MTEGQTVQVEVGSNAAKAAPDQGHDSRRPRGILEAAVAKVSKQPVRRSLIGLRTAVLGGSGSTAAPWKFTTLRAAIESDPVVRVTALHRLR